MSKSSFLLELSKKHICLTGRNDGNGTIIVLIFFKQTYKAHNHNPVKEFREKNLKFTYVIRDKSHIFEYFQLKIKILFYWYQKSFISTSFNQHWLMFISICSVWQLVEAMASWQLYGRALLNFKRWSFHLTFLCVSFQIAQLTADEYDCVWNDQYYERKDVLGASITAFCLNDRMDWWSWILVRLRNWHDTFRIEHSAFHENLA